MKPAGDTTRAVAETTSQDGDIDPDYYVQKQTGRAIFKVILIVGAVQLSGVFLWLTLVLTGIFDATQNLGEFMVSQLVVFVVSIAVGGLWFKRHVSDLKAEAQAMESDEV